MKIQDSLNESLDLLKAGASVAECLARYPEESADLEPLLQAAVVLRQASAIPLRPQFRAEGRARVVGAMAALRSRQARAPTFGWAWRYAIAGTLIVFLSTMQVIRVSAQSLPGDVLYPVKRTVEQVQLTLTFSPTAKLELTNQLADKRVQELVAAANDRDLDDPKQREQFQKQAEKLVQSQASRVQEAASLADKSVAASERQAIAAQVQQDFERQAAKLWQAAERAPESAQPALRQAIEKATEGYQKALAAVATPEPRKDKVEGVLGAVRPQDRVVIILRDKEVPLTLTIPADSQITRNGAAVTVEALASGDLVKVAYDRDSLRAISIEARSPAQARGERVEFAGIVESQQNDRWVVSGRTVLVGPGTDLDVRGPVIGAQARVIAETRPDGSFLATKLTVRPAEEAKRPETPQRVQFTGTIDNIAPTRWLVSGREIVISQETTIKVDGVLKPGAQARVEAEQRPDGSLLAREIRVTGAKEADRDRGTDRDRDGDQDGDRGRNGGSDSVATPTPEPRGADGRATPVPARQDSRATPTTERGDNKPRPNPTVEPPENRPRPTPRQEDTKREKD
ncbi:MAG: hypothetical protein HYY01_13650 [Chloroflexi bacterium]|nr:hypothetical protein [Chloroflexota bacterium]